ncbi:nucleoside deaminase [Acinetobacter sp. V91_7]|uniref:nucleoside deaminase n=1 Tax=unclassified Acinetobacter TaxID=196816 RepID=UPI00287CB330|nr:MULTISPECIES: nucleoside deaminase [unclassified Acinetobacter]MDS7933940.1 nucleoside deaminase [Acinetobacter sp. V91_4B]MDS7962724.1 nucleoside deaminase [Acinetobacter sp. V91_7]MDS8029373.1 nucleoside deaminase [Acinetobacter sp. V91_13]
MEKGEEFLREAIELAYNNIEKGGRPFGAVVVKNGEVIASGVNQILTTNDPTAHAELLAIRAASQVLGSANLEGCSVYASGHPCPMCMAAMRLAGIKSVSYAYSNEDGTPFVLSTAEIYIELAKPFAEQSMEIQYIPIRVENRTDLYAYWKNYQANHSGSE